MDSVAGASVWTKFKDIFSGMIVAHLNFMKLEEIMSKQVVTIEAWQSAHAAWSKMKQRKIRHLIVTENDELVGVLSERDLGGRSGSATRRGCTVQDLMSTQVATVESSTSLRQAANLMQGRLIGCLPVLKKNHLVGIVTATDVLDALGQDRARHRISPSEDRAPFARQIPRQVRASSGRAPTPLIPAHIYQGGTRATNKLDEYDKAYVRRKLGMKLGKFSDSIERVTVRIEDINGPRGGIDQICRVKVVLSGLPSILVEEQSHDLQAAIDKALAKVEGTVRRQLQRRRQKPLRQASRLKEPMAA